MRAKLKKGLDSKEFKKYYYLKEELISFCREEGLAIGGKKEDLNKRIVHYLDTGEKLSYKRKVNKEDDKEITLTTKIGTPVTYSEKKRAFFEYHLGAGFKFKVAFQRWLKENSDKTYQEAIEAYPNIVAQKPEKIDKQFEYNTYIRDFFKDNKGKSLKDAIACWKYKKSMPGHNRYEKKDLVVLKGLY
ncbi:hypothetical protein M2475_001987 [Breznakia sp. PF5-3]|uniref:DUF6434 domain-containing protein n=1 Tax=unclassified Breznakia TaxID=2623764 RepID=UPI0024056F83|nr:MULTISPECIES: DUF6434 domain-containing protein [unclassified Breznakia]MDL2276546.1 SAP domain-containing protein [Breznakia sp. OttesenSCG-928-G09]MDF9825549.1 hypothetical protein [Breznakia sp. PM6-1]MDF9836407.1 hypothetical protein [Breznakia sp. PF5-3]MDF9838202.1 hypothetical protein [Breznakia sp. PFB2-8]MDF9860205.1 hypothetical protein [Breznakia sp. PH5-24]